jgi:hypothetical protein
MRGLKLFGPAGLVVCLMLVGCGQGNRQGSGGITDQGPNQVVLTVAGMT